MGLVLLAPHGFWFERCTSWMPRAEVVSGYGALLIVLGLLVAARPFIKAGVRATAQQQVHSPNFGAYAGSWEHIRQVQAGHERRVAAVVPGVIAERIVAVIVVVIGTLMNGYGGVIARGLSAALGLEACP